MTQLLIDTRQNNRTITRESLVVHRDDDDDDGILLVSHPSNEEDVASDERTPLSASARHMLRCCPPMRPPPSPSSSISSSSSFSQSLWWWWPEGVVDHGSFFLGTAFATIAAASDLKDAVMECYFDADCDCSGGTSDEDAAVTDDYVDDAYGKEPLQVWNFFKILSVASTLMYLVDSLLHVQCWNRWFGYNHRPHVQRLSLPGLFGVAAGFDLASCIFDDEYEPWPSYWMETGSVNLFLLCSLLTIRTNYCSRYSNEQHKNKLLVAGDVFFLSGCVIDVFVCFWENPNKQERWVFTASLSLLSSLTWMIDSILFFLADRYYHRAGDHDDEEEEIDTDVDDEEEESDHEIHHNNTCLEAPPNNYSQLPQPSQYGTDPGHTTALAAVGPQRQTDGVAAYSVLSLTGPEHEEQ